MNDAAVGPPGVMPIQQPTSALRSSVIQCRGSVSDGPRRPRAG